MNDYDLALIKKYLSKVKEYNQIALYYKTYQDDVEKRVLETEIKEINYLIDTVENMS